MHMKLNWGTGIVVAFVAFISFILYFVITMSTNKKYEHDLVIENYYGQELEFQNAINKEIHSRTLKQDIVWKRTSQGLLIEFPENFKPQDIKGTISLYRPSSKLLDFEVPILLSDYTFLITDKCLLDGRWNLKIDWKVNSEAYLYKKEIVY